MRKLILNRIQAYPDRILGSLHIYEGIYEIGRFCILELPWKENQRNISCIPAGCYRIKPEVNERFKDHFRISDVKGRSGILCHRGNFPKDTRGCLLAGLRFADLDSDGLFDISQSDAALRLISATVKEEAELYIFDATKDLNV